jgi:hypothetical protein
VLTAVIGIGFVVFRQQRGTELVAMRTKQASGEIATEPNNETQVVNPSKLATPPAVASGAPVHQSPTQPDKNDLQDKKSLVREEAKPTDSTALAKAPAKDGREAGEGVGLFATQPYSPEPKAGAPAPPPAVVGEVDKSAEVAKERPEKREDQDRSRDTFKNQADDEHGPSRSRNNSAAPVTQRAPGTFGVRGGPSGIDKNKVGTVETRSVSGRRFTRAENVWVDTDYNAPRATINVKRGTDQFRALVADEPGIRAIADQLSGAVIVVWKNHAYRIQ